MTPTVNITTDDLKFVVDLINICAQRGAIRPDEFPQVGTFYQKIMTVLAQASVHTAAPPELNTATE